MKNFPLYSIILLIAIGLMACAKKETPVNAGHYGIVMVHLSTLPGTPELEARYQDNKIGDVPFMEPGVTVKTSDKARLAVYKKGTDELVADTLLNLKQGEKVALRVACSDDLNLRGWINSAPVPADSGAVLLYNNLGDYYKKLTSYDLEIWVYDPEIRALVPTGHVFHNFNTIKLTNKAILLRVENNLGLLSTYVIKIRDNATGQFIIQPNGRDYTSIGNAHGGVLRVYNLWDDNGQIYTEAADL